MQDKSEQKREIEGRGYYKVINLFGLLSIENKTDILAFAAFLIALVSATYQATAYLKGPDIQLFSPDRIMLEKRQGPDGNWLLGVVAPMNYVNSGDIGYNGIVRREFVLIKLADKTYKYSGQEFVSSTSEGKKLKIISKSEARPFPVYGAGSESHETRFTPYQPRCPDNDRECMNANFLTTDTFFDDVHKVKKLNFDFVADVFPKEQLCASCTIDVNPSIWAGLAINKWVTLQCWESQCTLR